MMKNPRFIPISTLVVLLSGCVPVPEPEPVQVVQPPEPPQNLEVLSALSELVEIKEDLKQLRNAVEEIQFETENAKRRQQDLFQDLDRRMISVERNQGVLNPQPADRLNGDAVVGEDGIIVRNDPLNSAGGTGNAAAPQVVVIDDNNNQDTGTATAADTTVPSNTTSASTTGSASVTLQEQQAYDEAFEMLKQSRYEDAIMQFQQMVDTWPHSQLADDAYYWMSEARYVNREFEQALSGFKTVVSRYPDSQRIPEALLKVGYIQYDIGVYEEAADTFRDILARFPGHQVTVSAQTKLRRIENTIQ